MQYMNIPSAIYFPYIFKDLNELPADELASNSFLIVMSL